MSRRAPHLRYVSMVHEFLSIVIQTEEFKERVVKWLQKQPPEIPFEGMPLEHPSQDLWDCRGGLHSFVQNSAWTDFISVATLLTNIPCITDYTASRIPVTGRSCWISGWQIIITDVHVRNKFCIGLKFQVASFVEWSSLVAFLNNRVLQLFQQSTAGLFCSSKFPTQQSLKFRTTPHRYWKH
jgi:hypothetical protein